MLKLEHDAALDFLFSEQWGIKNKRKAVLMGLWTTHYVYPPFSTCKKIPQLSHFFWFTQFQIQKLD